MSKVILLSAQSFSLTTLPENFALPGKYFFQFVLRAPALGWHAQNLLLLLRALSTNLLLPLVVYLL